MKLSFMLNGIHLCSEKNYGYARTRHTTTLPYKNVKKQEKKKKILVNFAIFHHARVIFVSESDDPQKSCISILCDPE